MTDIDHKARAERLEAAIIVALKRFQRLRRALGVGVGGRRINRAITDLLDALRDQMRDGERDAVNAIGEDKPS